MLPSELSQALRSWAAEFNRSFDWEHGWPNEAIATAHRIEGERLFYAVKAALPNNTVTFDFWEIGFRES